MNSDANDVREHSHDLTMRGASTSRALASRSIARMKEPHALTRRQLEERRLIHREAGARAPADAFRELRMRLLSLGNSDNFVTLVASVSPGSGGSFVARNLAAAFAFDSAMTALLIDCNLRYPVQHAALGVDPVDGGLIDYLEQPGHGVQEIIYGTGIRRLRMIPAGHAHESSAEHFSSFRMKALIVSLRSRYADRYLILDGPALRNSPDARILSDLADFVVVVAAYGRDTATAINQAVAGLDPKKLVGVVFNHPP
jgi:protein-tyrosine kinase